MDLTMTATMHQFKLPDLGEGVHEGQIIRIHVAEGQQIHEDDPLMEVETDKAAVEITSPVTGLVSEVHVSERQLVHVGEVMVTFESNGGVAPSTPSTSRISDLPTEVPAGVSPPQRHRPPASPSVRRLARERGVNLNEIGGSGPGGRITRADLERPCTAEPAPPPETISNVPIPAARVVTTPRGATTELEGTADTDRYGAIVRQSLSQARRAISRAMQTSWKTIPHVTDCNDADITELESIRRSYTDAEHPDRRITVLAFVVR
ncbi:MAG: biotin/lipoyl-containing protein, partial [Phycisphaerales bacterium]|nr:biotin/lipoyl-containing protein [Phycisphaerales bacterium]